MLIYWLVFSLPLITFVAPFKVNNDTKNLFHFIYLFIITIFVGLRTNTGGDWKTNNHVFDGIAIFVTEDAITKVIKNTEIGYYLLIQIAKLFNLGFHSFNFIISIFSIYCIYKLGKLSKGYLSTYVICFPYIITVVFFGFVRQGIAFCFLILAIYFFTNNKKYPYLYFYIFTIIGTLFHKSLIVFLFIPLLFIKINLRSLFLIFLCLIITIIIFYLNYEEYLRLHRFYLGEDMYFSSSGAIMRWGLNFIPSIIYILYLHKFIENKNERRLFYILSLISIFSIFIISDYSSFVDRYLIYFSLLQPYVYGRMFFLLKDNIINYLFRIIIVIFYILIYFIWFNFSIHSSLWIPYDNILFFGKYI